MSWRYPAPYDFYDPPADAENPLDMRTTGKLDSPQGRRVVSKLTEMIEEHSIFFHTIRNNMDNMKRFPEMKLVISSDIKPRDDHSGAYNLPTSDTKTGKRA